jgi:hypothetical protein
MDTIQKFDCKHEEIVVICDYVQMSMGRDLKDFTAFSPKFDEKYLAEFKTKNEAMNKVIFPAEKTKELKIITARLYAVMDKLHALLDQLDGYIKLAKDAVPLSVKDFGITYLKQKIRRRDAEGTLKGLQQVNSNVKTYQEPLAAQGLTIEKINQLNTAFLEIDAENQKQYEKVSARRLLTAENIRLFNDMYDQMMEICNVGKILYKKTQKEKLPDYTFSYLKKKVRVS